MSGMNPLPLRDDPPPPTSEVQNGDYMFCAADNVREGPYTWDPHPKLGGFWRDVHGNKLLLHTDFVPIRFQGRDCLVIRRVSTPEYRAAQQTTPRGDPGVGGSDDPNNYEGS